MSTIDRPAVDDFPQQTDRYRQELFAHCYRMLGSVHDAEDLVQETYLRAWRSYHSFEHRSSVRTWLYRIATNACLTAIEGRARRPLPTGLGTPSAQPGDPLESDEEVPWLQPVPDALVDQGTGDPEAAATSKESIRLAFVAALQHLPPRQRAVLVLRDVLAWKAAEVAEAVGVSTAAVNSILQRARAQLAGAQLTEEAVSDTIDDQQRQMLDRYVAAFWDKDIDTIVDMLTSDAVWEMPPHLSWYQGAAEIGRLIDLQCPGGVHEMRMVETWANGQPAYGLYLRDDDGGFSPFHLQVLTLDRDKVSHVVAFFDVSLFATFGLPDRLPADMLPA